MIVGAGRHEDPGIDLKRRPHALARQVHAGMDLGAVAKLPVIVEMHEPGFLESIEAPEAAEIHVRPQLLDADEVLRAKTRHQHRVGLAVAAPAQEPDLRIEATAHFLITEVEVPLWAIGLRADVEGMIARR